jgi:hypothetical protein
MVRPGATLQSRQIALENLGTFVGVGTGMLLAAKQLGADVEIDPRSSDFGKMRWGNTRIEFWGGYQPIARYVAQISTAQRKGLTDGKVEFAYPGDSAMRFFRSKLSPAGSLVYDYGINKGKGYAGEDLLFNPTELGWDKETRTHAWNIFGKRLLPLSIQSAVDGYQASGWQGALAGGGLSSIGGGVGSFEASDTEQKTAARDKFEEETLKPLGARIVDGEVWPDQLDKDFKSSAWQQLFKADVPELPTTEYTSLSELGTAYVDYWWEKKGDPSGVGEQQRKADLRRVFDGYDSVKQFKKNIEFERLELWKRDPQALKDATAAGTNTLNEDERKILDEAGIPY